MVERLTGGAREGKVDDVGVRRSCTNLKRMMAADECGTTIECMSSSMEALSIRTHPPPVEANKVATV